MTAPGTEQAGPDGPGPVSGNRSERRVVSARLLAGLFVASLFILSGLSSFNDWNAEKAKAENLARAVAHGAAEQIGGSLRTIDLLIQYVGQAVAAEGRPPSEGMPEGLQVQSLAFPEMRAIILADEHGHGWRHDEAKPVSLAERDYFRVQRFIHARNQVVIDGPLLSGPGDSPEIVVARPILDPAGGFRGVAAAALDPGFFADPLTAADVELRASALLTNINGVVFNAFPDAGGLGRILPAGMSPWQSGAEVGTFRTDAFANGAEHIGAFHMVRNYPLAVTVLIPVDGVRATWWRSARVSLLIQIGIGVMMLWLATLFDRGQEQRLRDLAAKSAAERASEMKSRFLAVASHDLRQPVQALALYFNIFRKRPEVDAGEEVVGRMGECIGSLSRLLDSLLDISKLEAGSVTPTLQAVPLRPLMERLWADFSPVAELSGISLSVVPTSARVVSDAILLERILQNLLSNAIRYGRPGGKVLMGCRRGRWQLTLQVLDNGIGIRPEHLGKVFEEFYRGPQAVPGERGLGLGLPIVRRLAALLGHNLGVASEHGRGSLFDLRIRLAGDEGDTEHAAEEAGPAPDPRAIGGRTILVIDDDARLRDSLRLQLEDWGVRVAVAASQADGATLVDHGLRPDLLLVDYRLGENRTGLEAADAIRRMLGQPVPTVLLTGETTPAELHAATQWTGRVLHKPVSPDTLLKALVEELSAPGTGIGTGTGTGKRS